jgi:hypothetical protein
MVRGFATSPSTSTMTPSCVNRGRVLVAALFVAMTATARTAQANPISYPFGTVQNEAYGNGPGAGGICVAASFINGSTYLKNAFPTVYGGTPLATGNLSSGKAAMEHFAVDGWTAPNGTAYTGYYTRTVQDNGAGIFGDWWQSMIDWTEGFAPGRTAYSGQAAASLLNGENPAAWTLGSNVSDQFPSTSFLRAAATNNDFVELGVYEYTITGNQLNIISGHAINLADVTYSSGVYTLKYQDPNFPTVQFYSATLSTLTINGQPAIKFYEVPTYGSNVFIAAAFTESGLPEPSAMVLLGTGVIALAGILWRRRQPAA